MNEFQNLWFHSTNCPKFKDFAFSLFANICTHTNVHKNTWSSLWLVLQRLTLLHTKRQQTLACPFLKWRKKIRSLLVHCCSEKAQFAKTKKSSGNEESVFLPHAQTNVHLGRGLETLNALTRGPHSWLLRTSEIRSLRACFRVLRAFFLSIHWKLARENHWYLRGSVETSHPLQNVPIHLEFVKKGTSRKCGFF